MFELDSILKHAQDFGGKIHEIHEQLNQIKVKGLAAGGLVTVEVNGHQSMLMCKIDPELFKNGDQELLEELIIAATNDAIAESRVKQNELLQSVASDSNVPSIVDIMSKIMSK